MDTTMITLPTDLVETIDAAARRRGTSPADLMRDALAAYVVDEADEIASEPQTNDEDVRKRGLAHGTEESPEFDATDESIDGERQFASLGVGESRLPSWFGIAEAPDDGYDSSNIKDWIRKTWKPE